MPAQTYAGVLNVMSRFTTTVIRLSSYVIFIVFAGTEFYCLMYVKCFLYS
jgi:hypothetical protein